MNAAQPLLGLVVMLHSGCLWQAPDLMCDKAAAVARSQNLTPNVHLKKTNLYDSGEQETNESLL